MFTASNRKIVKKKSLKKKLEQILFAKKIQYFCSNFASIINDTTQLTSKDVFIIGPQVLLVALCMLQRLFASLRDDQPPPPPPFPSPPPIHSYGRLRVKGKAKSVFSVFVHLTIFYILCFSARLSPMFGGSVLSLQAWREVFP